MNETIQKLTKDRLKKKITPFAVGDDVTVQVRIVEGDRERVQAFTGTCIGKKGGGIQETFTLRRVTYGEGVERCFLLHSPRMEKITVKRRGKVRRAKLYYLRSKIGKKAKVKEA